MRNKEEHVSIIIVVIATFAFMCWIYSIYQDLQDHPVSTVYYILPTATIKIEKDEK